MQSILIQKKYSSTVKLSDRQNRMIEVVRAIDDGRPDRIVEEHKHYMKETGREIWAL